MYKRQALFVAAFSLLALAAGVALGAASVEHFLSLASFPSDKVRLAYYIPVLSDKVRLC